jgi:diacylglycerol kinase (ATP)
MQIKLDESSNTTSIQPDMASKVSNSVNQQLERNHQQRVKAWRVATSLGVSSNTLRLV